MPRACRCPSWVWARPTAPPPIRRPPPTTRWVRCTSRMRSRCRVTSTTSRSTTCSSTLAPAPTRTTSTPAAPSKGIEGEATYMIGQGLAAYGNVGVNSAKYKASNAASGQPTGDVPNAPNVTTALGALYNIGPWNASLIFKRIGEQYNAKIGGKLNHIDNTDLNVAYTFKNVGALMGAKALKLQFSVFNLTNKQNLVAASGPLNSASTQYQWQAPRSYMLSARADF